MFTFCCAIPLLWLAPALSLPLRRLAVPTSIEGTPVVVYVSGTANLTLSEDGAVVDSDLSLDLSDLQTKFASIVRSRTADTPCTESVTLTAGALRWAAGYVEAAATASLATWRCENQRRVQQLTEEHGAVRFRIDAKTTTDAWLAIGVEMESVDGSSHLQRTLARFVAGKLFADAAVQTLNSALSPQTIVAPLPSDVRDLRPQIKRVAFVQLESNAIGVLITASLTIPRDKIPMLLGWAMGGE